MAPATSSNQPQLLQVSPICITLPPSGTEIHLKALVSDLTCEDLAHYSEGSPRLTICYNGKCLSHEEVSFCQDPDHQSRVPAGETTASPFADASAASDHPESTLQLQITIHKNACASFSPGCLTLELQSGSGSRALPVLLVREADIAGEVIQLQQEAGTADRLLIDLGSWVASAASATAAAASQQQQLPPPIVIDSTAPQTATDKQGLAPLGAIMANGSTTLRPVVAEGVAPGLQQRETHRSIRLGLRLLAYSCSRGWPQTSNHLVSGLTALGLNLADVDTGVRSVHGLGLLHTCMQSQSAELVWLLHAWALLHPHTWDLKFPGPHGLTPLHIAAVLPSGAPAAVQLLSIFPSSCALWFSVRDDNGCTPARYAQLAVNEHLNQHAIAVLAMDAALVDVQRPNDLFLGSSLNGTTMEDGRCEGGEDDSFTDEAFARAIAAATTTVPASLLASGFSMGTGASSGWQGHGSLSQLQQNRRAAATAASTDAPVVSRAGGEEGGGAGATASATVGVLGLNWQLLHPQPYADTAMEEEFDEIRTWGSSMAPTGILSSGEGVPARQEGAHGVETSVAQIDGLSFFASSSGSARRPSSATLQESGDIVHATSATVAAAAAAVASTPASSNTPSAPSDPAQPDPVLAAGVTMEQHQSFPGCVLRGFSPSSLEATYRAHLSRSYPLSVDVALLAMYLCVLLLLRPSSPDVHHASLGRAVLSWTASSPLFPTLQALPVIGPLLASLKKVEIQGAAYSPPGSLLSSSIVDPQSATSLLLFVQRLPHIIILIATMMLGQGRAGNRNRGAVGGWIGILLDRNVLFLLAAWIQTILVVGMLATQSFPVSGAWAGLSYFMGVQQPVVDLVLGLLAAAGQQVRLPTRLAISAAAVTRQLVLLAALGQGSSREAVLFMALQQLLAVGVTVLLEIRRRLHFLSTAST